jgi:hypothetical protein
MILNNILKTQLETCVLKMPNASLKESLIDFMGKCFAKGPFELHWRAANQRSHQYQNAIALFPGFGQKKTQFGIKNILFCRGKTQ